MVELKKLYISENHFLAYKKLCEGNYINEFGVVFLSGYMSDMEGAKALHLEETCAEMKVPFIRFDYSACGESSGDISKIGHISQWKNDVLNIIDDFTEVKKVILVGSSMGGWLMLLAALERKNRVKALLGIASAPDFTEDLMWDVLPKAAQCDIMEQGFHKMPTDYCDDPNAPEKEQFYLITKALIEEGRKNLLLNDGANNNAKQIEINVPIKLIHGTQDEDVPYKYSLALKEKITSKNIEVILQLNGKHRMSSPQDLQLIKDSLKSLING